MSPRSAKRARIGKVSPKTMPPRLAKRARIGKVSSNTMPLRSAKRARIGKVSPKTKQAAVKVEEVIVSDFEAKGEIKVEEIIENKPYVVAPAMPPRSAKRVRIGKVSPKTKEAAVKVEEDVVSVFGAKGEIKVEINQNKPNEEKPLEPEPNPIVAQGVYEALELRDGGSDYLGKSVLKEACDDIQKVNHEYELRFFGVFCHATRYFTQYFDFCDYLKNECKFIKHDSVPKEVYDSGELPLSRFDMLREDDIIDLLQCYSNIMESKAKARIDLESQYSIYLTKCDFIKWDSDASEILGILKEEKKFKEKKFSSLGDYTLNHDLQEYIWYLDDLRYNPGTYMGKRFSVIMKKRIEMWNYVEWPPVNHLDGFMELVHRAHSKKHTMDEDPFTEMRKQFPNW